MNPKTHYDIKDNLRYISLLSQSFPSVAAASTEIINLEAILNLPKGTEHFLADLHGEYQAFHHILKNASGNIKRKVNELFGSEIRENEKDNSPSSGHCNAAFTGSLWYRNIPKH